MDWTPCWSSSHPPSRRLWPFTAIRLDNGNTLIGCTNGNRVIEVDGKGKIVWSVDNEDLGEDLIKDACGVQRLPNGNTVITSYYAKGDKAVKLGAQTAMPMCNFEGEFPNKPIVAMEVYDRAEVTETWSEDAKAPFADVLGDPVAWAKKCPGSHHGTVEVRPVMIIPGDG